LTKFGVRKPFVFYVGGPDFRKNMIGLMRGFSAIPTELRRSYQLVIGYNATPEERQEILLAAKSAGVDEGVVLTGFISDKDLAALYNLCDLFPFPSLYEGFGLPVLEAMSCGAATIASNVSSIPEILPRRDCLFDPQNAEDIGRVITSVLQDEDFRQSLRRYGIERAKEFSWKRTAKLALDAFENAHQVKAQRTRIGVPVQAKSKLAYFSPLPPAKSGISSYSAELLPYLADHFEIDAYVDDYSSKENIQGAGVVHEHTLYPRQAEKYFATLYQVGNSPYHHYMRPYMRDYRGVATVHDAFLGHLSHDPGRDAEFCKLAVQMHGGEARKILMASADYEQASHAAIRQLTCSRLYFEQSLGAITHSRFAKQLIENTASLKVAPAVRVIPQLRSAEEPSCESSRRMARSRLSLGLDGTYVASFGHLASTKSIIQIVNAFQTSNIGSRQNNRLLLVGELEGGSYGRLVREAIAAGPAASRISVTGFVDEATYKLYLEAADIAIQLRCRLPSSISLCRSGASPVRY
jgi:glycosyltransferase involved in cell wall biosynthesis